MTTSIPCSRIDVDICVASNTKILNSSDACRRKFSWSNFKKVVALKYQNYLCLKSHVHSRYEWFELDGDK
jgi:hypothetical protein